MQKDDKIEIHEEKIPDEPQLKKNREPSNLIRLPELRESLLPPLMPLSNVFVSFPSARPSLISKTMYYKIEFQWDGETKNVTRKFSDFENLREALVSLLPFSFIFPVHRKQFFVF